MNYRNYDEVLNKLKKNREYHQCFLELLEKIEIRRKKDGTHFVNKSQTFFNAKYTGNVDNTIKFPELQVTGRTKSGIWETFSIRCYVYEEDLPIDDERRKQVISGGYTKDCYNFTTDEIIEQIEKEKKIQKQYIENYDKQIDASKKIFDEVSEKMNELSEFIKKSTYEFRNDERKIYPSSLEYALQDYVKDNIR